MFATDSDYEEAIRGASIHAYKYRENKKRLFIKVLLFATIAVLLSLGFIYYKKDLFQEVQKIVSTKEHSKNLLDNSQLTQKVLEIGSEGDSIQSRDDEYLNALKHLSETSTEKDEYLVALESMEVDVLDDSQQNSRPTTLKSKEIVKKHMSLASAISSLVDESTLDSSKYTNELRKEIISEYIKDRR